MAHEPFRGGRDNFSSLPPLSMMGLMYKPELKYVNSSDAAYTNAMARAKVLQSGNEFHRHTYRGFSGRAMTGGDVPRGLSKAEVTHVLKQLKTQQVDTEGMFEELPSDMTAAELMLRGAPDPQSTVSPVLPTLPPTSTNYKNVMRVFTDSLTINLRKSLKDAGVPLLGLLNGIRDIVETVPQDEEEVKEQLTLLLQDIAPPEEETLPFSAQAENVALGVFTNNAAIVATLTTLLGAAIVTAFQMIQPSVSAGINAGAQQILNTYERHLAAPAPPVENIYQSPAPQPQFQSPVAAPRAEAPMGGPMRGTEIDIERPAAAPVGGQPRDEQLDTPAPAQPQAPRASPPPPFPDAVAPLGDEISIQRLYSALPDVDKRYLMQKGYGDAASLETDRYSAKWRQVLELRLKFLTDDPEFLPLASSFALQPSNNSPVVFLQFLRRSIEGVSGRSGFGKYGGMVPGYSIFNDRAPVWGRRWRHYKPTAGHLTVAEQNKLFGKTYETTKEAIEGNEKYRKDRLKQERIWRNQAKRHGRGKKVRKSKTRRSVKHAATPKRHMPSAKIEHLRYEQQPMAPSYDDDDRVQYEDNPADISAFQHLANSLRSYIKKGGVRLRKTMRKRRKYGRGISIKPEVLAAASALAPAAPGAPYEPLKVRLERRRQAMLAKAPVAPVATGGKRRRRGGARLIGGKLWVPMRSDPLYTMN